MNVKKWFSQLKKEVGKVKSPKPNKSKVELKPRKISQKAANRLLLGFVAGVVLLSTLTIVSNTFRSLRNDKNEIQVTNKNSRTYSNQVSLFMMEFLNVYFSENNAENQAKLKEYYGSGIDIKNTENNRMDSQLTGATLVEVTDNLATYRVTYSVKKGEEWQPNYGLLHIPYAVKDNKFYVSDLPYFTKENSYAAKYVKAGIHLQDQQDSKQEFGKAKEYVQALFTAYTSGDKTQLTPFSKDIQPLEGYQLTSIDYSYFITDKDHKDKLVDVLQVTFTDGLGLSHQENFVVTLKVDKENDTFRVQSFEHGIAEKYQKQMK